MADAVVFRFSSEEARAVQGFLRLMDAQKKVEDQTEKTSRKLREQKGIGDSVAVSFTKMATGLLSVTAVTSGVRMLADEMARLDKSARSVGESALGVMLQQDKGKAEEVKKLIEDIAARYGQFRTAQQQGAAYTSFGSIQATNGGNLARAIEDFTATMQAAEVGIGAQDISNFIAVTRAKGGSGPLAVAQLFKAAQNSSMEAAQFAPIAASTLGYQNPAVGLAAGVAFSSAGFEPTRVPEKVKDLDLALQRLEDKDKKLQGLSEEAQIAIIAEKYGNASLSKLQKLVGDEGKAIALKYIMMMNERFQSEVADIVPTSSDFPAQVLVEKMGESATVRGAIEANRAVSAGQLKTLRGGDTSRAQGLAESERRLVGNIADFPGRSLFVNEEDGTLSNLAKPFMITGGPMFVALSQLKKAMTGSGSGTSPAFAPGQGASSEGEGEAALEQTANARILGMMGSVRNTQVGFGEAAGMMPGGGIAKLGINGAMSGGRFAGMGGLGSLARRLEKYTGTIMDKMSNTWTPAVVGAGTNIASFIGGIDFPDRPDKPGPGFSTRKLMSRHKDRHHGAINDLVFGTADATPVSTAPMIDYFSPDRMYGARYQSGAGWNTSEESTPATGPIYPRAHTFAAPKEGYGRWYNKNPIYGRMARGKAAIENSPFGNPNAERLHRAYGSKIWGQLPKQDWSSVPGFDQKPKPEGEAKNEPAAPDGGGNLVSAMTKMTEAMQENTRAMQADTQRMANTTSGRPPVRNSANS